MELREIATFLQVAQWKSFSRAAKHLDYSQAAVTIQIKQLEKELGVHLFDRIGKQTMLTYEGEIFYEYASAVMRELAQAKDAVTDAAKLTGRLRLGAIESICSCILPALLDEYHRLHPMVSVSIVKDSPETLLEMMNNSVLDIVYFMDKRIYDKKWVKALEEPEDVIFVTSTEFPGLKKEYLGRQGGFGRKLSLEQIIEQPFILTEKNASYRLILDQYLASEGKEIRPFLEIGDTGFIINMLKNRRGVSFLPRFTVQKEIQEGELAALPVEDFQMRVWRQAVYHKDKWVTREMAEFLRLIREGR